MENASNGEFDLERYLDRSRKLDLSDIAWEDAPKYPLPRQAVESLQYMQDIEGHTIVYLRELLATRAIDDPDIAAFFACWFYEETFHSRALAQFLRAAGHEVTRRRRSQATAAARFEAFAIAALARLWPDFVAVHMTWGAINEITTLMGYKRLSELAGHPVLADLLSRIMRDESRHFMFYYQQAERRLARSPRTARLTRLIVDRYWDPVGAGVRTDGEVRALAAYLMTGPEGRRAARKVDGAIRRLPGFAGAPLLEAWIERSVVRSPASSASAARDPAAAGSAEAPSEPAHQM